MGVDGGANTAVIMAEMKKERKMKEAREKRVNQAKELLKNRKCPSPYCFGKMKLANILDGAEIAYCSTCKIMIYIGDELK